MEWLTCTVVYVYFTTFHKFSFYDYAQQSVEKLPGNALRFIILTESS